MFTSYPSGIISPSTKPPLNALKGTTAGTSPVYTLAVPLKALEDCAEVVFKAHATSTTDPATLNVNGLGAKPLHIGSAGTAVSTAIILEKMVYHATYSSDLVSGGAWVVVEL